MMLHAEFRDMVVEEDSDGVLLVTLNRPEKLNALTLEMRESLRALPSFIAERDSIKAVIVSGAGRGFCSGADMSAGAPDPYARARGREEAKQTRYSWILDWRTIPKPTIAAINGPAAGGGLSIALACDLRFASDQATLGAIWVRRGLVPDMGASYMLPQLLGLSRALSLVWSGEMIEASKALQIGLVDEVVSHDDLLSYAHDYARTLARGPSLTIELAKDLLNQSQMRDFASLADLEDLYQRMLSETDDTKEAKRAYQERREPRFVGR